MELFSIGFLKVTATDVVDILLVAFIFHQLYRGMRGTIAAQILIGMVVIGVRGPTRSCTTGSSPHGIAGGGR